MDLDIFEEYIKTLVSILKDQGKYFVCYENCIQLQQDFNDKAFKSNIYLGKGDLKAAVNLRIFSDKDSPNHLITRVRSTGGFYLGRQDGTSLSYAGVYKSLENDTDFKNLNLIADMVTSHVDYLFTFFDTTPESILDCYHLIQQRCDPKLLFVGYLDSLQRTFKLCLLCNRGSNFYVLEIEEVEGVNMRAFSISLSNNETGGKIILDSEDLEEDFLSPSFLESRDNPLSFRPFFEDPPLFISEPEDSIFESNPFFTASSEDFE